MNNNAVQYITIDELMVNAVIGVFAWERAIAQAICVSACLHCKMDNALLSDDIDDAVNYKQVCDDIDKICVQEQAHLLEHLAFKILGHLFAHYPCGYIELRLTKPNAIKNAKAVGVHIAMGVEDFKQLSLESSKTEPSKAEPLNIQSQGKLQTADPSNKPTD